jgi:thymidine kinase
VESRNQNGCGKMEAVEFRSSDPWTVLPVLAATEQRIGKRVECVAIDEGQFVQDLFLFTKRLLESGYDVMVSGLELDFRGLPFGEMIDISWLVRTYSGNITELIAYCSCGAKAIYPQRLIDGKPAPYDSPIIMAGDFYEPRCADHFVLPGRPHYCISDSQPLNPAPFPVANSAAEPRQHPSGPLPAPPTPRSPSRPAPGRAR